jgi:hypothetical protein
MIDDSEIYTQTMAKIYAKQGHLEKAAEIYRYLLDQEPDRQDLVSAFTKVEKRLQDSKQKDDALLVTLFDQWINMALVWNNIRRLKTLRHRLEASQGVMKEQQSWQTSH